jgi:hypothetical protein
MSSTRTSGPTVAPSNSSFELIEAKNGPVREMKHILRSMHYTRKSRCFPHVNEKEGEGTRSVNAAHTFPQLFSFVKSGASVINSISLLLMRLQVFVLRNLGPILSGVELFADIAVMSRSWAVRRHHCMWHTAFRCQLCA